MDLTREALIEFFSKHGTVLDAKTYTSAHDVKKVCSNDVVQCNHLLSLFVRIEFCFRRF